MSIVDDFMFDVFLSYSSVDKVVVRSLAERLRKDGLRVWFDEWEIRPGDSIPSKIEEGLESSRVLVLCMSANAFGSDWSTMESQTFRFRDPLNKARRFIPIRLDEAPIKGSLPQFAYIRWLPADRQEGYAKLLEACLRDHTPEAVDAQSTRNPGRPRNNAPRWRHFVALLAVATFVLAALLAVELTGEADPSALWLGCSVLVTALFCLAVVGVVASPEQSLSVWVRTVRGFVDWTAEGTLRTVLITFALIGAAILAWIIGPRSLNPLSILCRGITDVTWRDWSGRVVHRQCSGFLLASVWNPLRVDTASSVQCHAGSEWQFPATVNGGYFLCFAPTSSASSSPSGLLGGSVVKITEARGQLSSNLPKPRNRGTVHMSEPLLIERYAVGEDPIVMEIVATGEATSFNVVSSTSINGEPAKTIRHADIVPGPATLTLGTGSRMRGARVAVHTIVDLFKTTPVSVTLTIRGGKNGSLSRYWNFSAKGQYAITYFLQLE